MRKTMACCAACQRHVLATEFVCPFCRGSVKACGSPLSLDRTAWLGTSLMLSAALLAGCRMIGTPTPAYGVPSPWSPSPSLAPSTPPSATPTP